METENRVNFTYMGTSYGDVDDDSSAFSECNSDRSGEFPTASSESRRLLMACVSENSDDLIRQLVADLESCSIDDKKQAAMENQTFGQELFSLLRKSVQNLTLFSFYKMK